MLIFDLLHVDCQNLLSTGLLQAVSTSCNKSANDKLQQLIATDMSQVDEIDKLLQLVDKLQQACKITDNLQQVCEVYGYVDDIHNI